MCFFIITPRYQGVEVEDLEFQRVLFGFFPTYKRSPLPAEWDRVCQIGDARCGAVRYIGIHKLQFSLTAVAAVPPPSPPLP